MRRLPRLLPRDRLIRRLAARTVPPAPPSASLLEPPLRLPRESERRRKPTPPAESKPEPERLGAPCSPCATAAVPLLGLGLQV